MSSTASCGCLDDDLRVDRLINPVFASTQTARRRSPAASGSEVTTKVMMLKETHMEVAVTAKHFGDPSRQAVLGTQKKVVLLRLGLVSRSFLF